MEDVFKENVHYLFHGHIINIAKAQCTTSGKKHENILKQKLQAYENESNTD